MPAGAVDNEETRQAAERKRVAIFLTLVGAETYKLLKSPVSPDVPSTRTFQRLTDTIRNLLKPRTLAVAERFRYHKRQQRDGETVSQFETELRSLASASEFGEFLGQALRDQLVCGIRNESTQRKLLSQERNFEQALQTATADESVESEAKAIVSQVNDNAWPLARPTASMVNFVKETRLGRFNN